MTAELVIKDLHVIGGDKPILHGVNLTVRQGEVHALMGPNGSGKSTLAYTIAGHPHYKVAGGDILLNGQSVSGDGGRRARQGRAVPGLPVPHRDPGREHGELLAPGGECGAWLQRASQGTGVRRRRSEADWRRADADARVPQGTAGEDGKATRRPAFARRYLNEGFSGGEKKRAEILQMAMLEPKIAVLDETDSGLDIDALRVVAEGVNSLVGPRWAPW